MPNNGTETKRRYALCSMLIGIIAYCISSWDDDVVFRNQARGTENKGKKEFVNVLYFTPHRLLLTLIMLLQDLLRSDFHKRFMVSISCG